MVIVIRIGVVLTILLLLFQQRGRHTKSAPRKWRGGTTVTMAIGSGTSSFTLCPGKFGASLKQAPNLVLETLESLVRTCPPTIRPACEVSAAQSSRRPRWRRNHAGR